LTPQAGLFLSAIAFVGLHFLLSHPLRAPLVAKLGAKGFQGLYSAVALITFGLMIYFYRLLGREPQVWNLGEWVWPVGAILMWLGSIPSSVTRHSLARAWTAGKLLRACSRSPGTR